MFKRTIRSMSIRNWVLLAMLSLLVSLCGLLGASFGLSGTGGTAIIPVFWCIALSFVAMVPVGFVFLVANAALTKLAFSSLNKDAATQQTSAREGAPDAAEEDAAPRLRPSRLSRFVPVLTAKSVALFAAIMIVFWSPYVVAAFPGQVYNDTVVQMQQVYPGAHPLELRSGGNIPLDAEHVDSVQERSEDVQRAQGFRTTDAWLVDHHPFALTLFLGGLASASDALFGNWMPALALLMGTCVVAMAAELTFGVAFLRRKGAPLGGVPGGIPVLLPGAARAHERHHGHEGHVFRPVLRPVVLSARRMRVHERSVPLPQAHRCRVRGHRGVHVPHEEDGRVCGGRHSSLRSGVRAAGRSARAKGGCVGVLPARRHLRRADVRAHPVLGVPGAQRPAGQQG